MNTKLLLGLGAGGLALLALSGAGGETPADGTKPAGEGLGPGTKIPGGPNPPAIDKQTEAKVTALALDLMNALGYAFETGDPVADANQIRRFQTQYNSVSRLAGSNLAGIPVPSNMGTVDVNEPGDSKIPAATKAALNAALAVSGGPEYVETLLKPYLLEEDDDLILPDTPWLDMVRAACIKHDQWLCVEWIDEGANPFAG